MGYTTKFRGKFTFDKEPSVAVIRQINEVHDPDECKTEYRQPFPNSYCQWQATKPLDGIEWDGGEKFYKYTEWLQWIIDNILKPAKLSIRGRVTFKGEDRTDAGTLVVEDDQHVRIEKKDSKPDDLKSLRAFRDFVYSHSETDDVLSAWNESQSQ